MGIGIHTQATVWLLEVDQLAELCFLAGRHSNRAEVLLPRPENYRFFQKISWSDAIGWLMFSSLHLICTGFFSQVFAGSSICAKRTQRS